MTEPSAQALEVQLSKLRAHLDEARELGLPTDATEARIAQLEAQLGEITDAQQKTWASILRSPRAQQIIGDDNVQIYIEQLVDATRQVEVERQFREYLRALWGRLVNLSMMPMTGLRAGVPLAAVYTALDITATVGIGSEERHYVSYSLARQTKHGRIFTSGNWPLIQRSSYVDAVVYWGDLCRRIELEAKRAKGKEYSRQVMALEAVATSPRLVLIGPTGSGKSTFAKFLALCLAGQFLNKNEANLFTLNQINIEDDLPERWMLPWPHGQVLPIFVELRHFVASAHFSSGDPANPEQRLLNYLEAETEFVPSLRDHLLENGRALLILDGLDEVPQAERSRVQLCEVVTAFTQRYEGCHVLVTSRPYAYEEGSAWRLDHAGFNDATLAPFNDEQIGAFIHTWYMHLAAQNQVPCEQVEKRTRDLDASLQGLRFLAESPLMLTMMTDLHASSGGRLPGGRAELYERSVELLLDRWNELRGREGPATAELGMTVPQIRDALEELAYKVHRKQGEAEDSSAADITSAELLDILDRHRPSDCTVDYRKVMDSLNQRSGILVADSPTHYRFPHRSYQEFMAACHLCETDFPNLLARLTAEAPNQWREVVLYAAGYISQRTTFATWALIEGLVPRAPTKQTPMPDAPMWYAALFAALAIVESGLHENFREQDQVKQERVRQWLERALEVGALPPIDRAAAGRVINHIGGDRRPGVCQIEDGVPMIAWVEVPAGEFLMGSDKSIDDQAHDDELPQYLLDLPVYHISKYPVTCAQFRPFVEGDGYTNPAYWTKAGRQWCGRENVTQPRFWENAEENIPNHPINGVSWYEAYAYCKWLSGQVGHEVRLPTEAEWEKAARGKDGRIYPWGNAFDASRCNAREIGIGRTSAVGMFPLTDGPWDENSLDMSGNVSEWCQSKQQAYPYDPNDGRENTEGQAERVLRSGSIKRRARTGNHFKLYPHTRRDDCGFRVVAPILP